MKKSRVVSNSTLFSLVLLLLFTCSCNSNLVLSNKSGIQKLNFPYKFTHYFMEQSRVIPLDNGSKYLAISESSDLSDHDTLVNRAERKHSKL